MQASSDLLTSSRSFVDLSPALKYVQFYEISHFDWEKIYSLRIELLKQPHNIEFLVFFFIKWMNLHSIQRDNIYKKSKPRLWQEKEMHYFCLGLYLQFFRPRTHGEENLPNYLVFWQIIPVWMQICWNRGLFLLIPTVPKLNIIMEWWESWRLF